MATDLLVDGPVRLGTKLIEQLVRDGETVLVAFWGRSTDDAAWLFYCSLAAASDRAANAAYRALYRAIEKVFQPPDDGPISWLSPAIAVLLDDHSPEVRAAIALRDRQLVKQPSFFPDQKLGQLAFESICIYPPLPRERFWVRMEYNVRYLKSPTSDEWTAKAQRVGLLRGVAARGAVSYSTAHWEGEDPKNSRFAVVTVLLEIDPQLDEEDLELPHIRESLEEQARGLADQMFRSRNPGAAIVHQAIPVAQG